MEYAHILERLVDARRAYARGWPGDDYYALAGIAASNEVQAVTRWVRGELPPELVAAVEEWRRFAADHAKELAEQAAREIRDLLLPALESAWISRSFLAVQGYEVAQLTELLDIWGYARPSLEALPEELLAAADQAVARLRTVFDRFTARARQLLTPGHPWTPSHFWWHGA